MSDLSKIEELYKRIDELEEIVKELHPTHAYFNPKPIEPECVSTLTDDEIAAIEDKAKLQCPATKSAWGEGRRAIANAACKAERERIAGLPYEMSLSDKDLYRFRNEKEHWQSNTVVIAKSAVAQFQRDLLEGKI